MNDPCPSSLRRLSSPFHEVDIAQMRLERLRRELGEVGGINPRMNIFEVDLDIQGYKPEDLKICVQDNTLTISGTHEKKCEDGTHYESQHFTRTFNLPENVERDKLKSCISKDGRISCLRIHGPVKQTANDDDREKAKEVPIPITHK